MDIWDANKLVLFIAFVVPGFISLKTYQLLMPTVSKDSSQQLIDAVAYSSINYALLLWPIFEVESHNLKSSKPSLYILFYVVVLLFAPIFWAWLLQKLRGTQLLQTSLPHPMVKPWDYVFSQRKPYWLIVTMKDGNQIAGRYDSVSFASSAPAAEQLYLEERWVLNEQGGFDRPRNESAGVLILASDIVHVEFFNLTQGESHVEPKEIRGPADEPKRLAARSPEASSG